MQLYNACGGKNCNDLMWERSAPAFSPDGLCNHTVFNCKCIGKPLLSPIHKDLYNTCHCVRHCMTAFWNLNIFKILKSSVLSKALFSMLGTFLVFIKIFKGTCTSRFFQTKKHQCEEELGETLLHTIPHKVHVQRCKLHWRVWAVLMDICNVLCQSAKQKKNSARWF